VSPRREPGWSRRGLWARLSLSSSIRRRIVVINGLGLVMLVGGVLYLNQFREGLLDLRAEALRTHGEIIAIAVAENAGRPDALDVDPVRAALVLRRLTQPAGVRARLFDRGGRLVGDTRSFGVASAPVESRPLPPPDATPAVGLLERLVGFYGDYVELWSPQPELYREIPLAGVSEEGEVYAALEGQAASAIRVNSEGELIVSVAVPVQRFKAVYGALVLSTEGGDIDAIVRAERAAIIRVFLVALMVSVGLSLVLAGAIATPLRRLADAAARSGATENRAVDPEQAPFPDYGDRVDEIGYLSRALRSMTRGLYTRMAATERFAADVAHEIKNPLTSLRSAVETIGLARTEAQRERLLEVIAHDVRRLDRLVTDISNASRLDAELSREAMEPVDLATLLDAVADVTAERAETRGVRLKVSAPPGLTAMGLEGRLGQVFRNLVDNAVSFSPEGGTVRVDASARRGGGTVVTVEDDGPGMPEDKLEAIFERFWSERPEADGFGDHSGLGLSISRQIVEAHGGAIRAENRRDAPGGPVRGARFTVMLP
jgi:two-component system sensor histidine kinase ChvG